MDKVMGTLQVKAKRRSEGAARSGLFPARNDVAQPTTRFAGACRRQRHARKRAVSEMSADRQTDYLPLEDIATLPELLVQRARRSPEQAAYQYYDDQAGVWEHRSWAMVENDVARWRGALLREGLSKGDRVGVRRRNGYPWVLFDQAALSLGLVVVPLYVDDRADNLSYIIEQSELRLLLVQDERHWTCLSDYAARLAAVQRVVIETGSNIRSLSLEDARVIALDDWLVDAQSSALASIPSDTDAPATIIYTSGTTGRPKGVVLSHGNILANISAGLKRVAVYPSDSMLSFLPLSHALERSIGYYLPIAANIEVVYARSVAQLADDLALKKPSVIITVPRIFERVYSKLQRRLDNGPRWKKWLFEQTVAIGWQCFEHRQGRQSFHPRLWLWPLLDLLVARQVRQRLGGRLRFAISGGAALSPSISRIFIGLGIEILQGYGLTEAAPVIAVNALDRNRPQTVGLPFADLEVRLGENQELLVRGPNIMLGYWRDPAATAQVIDTEGWLHTGDQARIDAGFITLTGRLKEIIVLANGEKVSPVDMEAAILDDPLIEQVLVVGEQRPYLTALAVLNPEVWMDVSRTQGIETHALGSPETIGLILGRIAVRLFEFPGYAQVRQVFVSLDPWTVENGLATPTLKLKRHEIETRFGQAVEQMYAGH